MKILEQIALLLVDACHAASATVSSAATRTAKTVCLMAGFLAVAFALLLGAMGLMVAALFIGLTPYLGAHWAALIASGASLVGAGIFMALGLLASKGR